MTDLSTAYTESVTIASYDGDINRRIRPSSILKLQQEIGEQHLNSAGLSYSFLWDNGFVFLLTRAMSIIYEAPCFEDKVTLSTCSHGVKGVNFIRSYDFTDDTGKVLVHSVSTFVLVDPVKHGILRPSAVDKFGIIHNTGTSMSDMPAKISLPGNALSEEPRKIRFTDIDYNGHLNNVVYADIAMDYAPFELAKTPLKRFDINFIGEALHGDELAVASSLQDGVFYLGASHARGKCFTARFEFEG